MNQRARLVAFLSGACCIVFILTFALPSQAQQSPLNGQLTQHPVDPQDQAIEQNLSPNAAAPERSVQSVPADPSANDSLKRDQDASTLNQREDADRAQAGANPESQASESQGQDRRNTEVQVTRGTAPGGELPRTAGELPLLAFAGVISLVGAAGARLATVKFRR